MKELYELLLEKGYTIASCESLTGGLFAARMTEIPHVSQVLKGGIVSYWNEIKEHVVGVKKETIDAYGVVSKQTAYEMALNVQQKFEVNVAVSFTGNAGPSTLEDKPAGLVYTCIMINGEAHPFCDLIEMPRNELRQEIINRTVNRLKDILRNS
ncbi:MAG: nicotinamide-nucleotide amidohydrolase family protein [Erysipelotrichaceae bacterium]|nr:nicotinamide-nucleotide amidohydrolase family protein [Erysipelotrichaceae bacterium]